jgi:hypothetical protein
MDCYRDHVVPLLSNWSMRQHTIENGWLLTFEGLAFEDDLADVEAIAQEMRKRSAPQLVPARRMAPISVTSVKRRLVIVS